MIDFARIRTYPLASRKNKVRLDDFAGLDSGSLKSLIPDILAGRDVKKLAAAISEARAGGRGLLWMMGAHVIKCGLAPLIARFIELGYVTHLATNGAAPIHDLELALIGETSEEVLDGLKDGSFGMAKETGELVNEIINTHPDRGLGYSFGRAIAEGPYPHKEVSVFASAVKHGIPITVHSAIGTEIIQMHSSFDYANQSRKTYADFVKMTETVGSLDSGSVVLNIGSGVILPEIFLRSLNICRNLGTKAYGFTTAVFDMERSYRAYENVVHRPTEGGGTGFYIVGQHELMLPLLYWLVVKEGAEGK